MKRALAWLRRQVNVVHGGKQFHRTVMLRLHWRYYVPKALLQVRVVRVFRQSEFELCRSAFAIAGFGHGVSAIQEAVNYLLLQDLAKCGIPDIRRLVERGS